MEKLPKIAGWPDDYPKTDPKPSLVQFYQDLLALEKNPKLVKSSAWLSKFANNASLLEQKLGQQKEPPLLSIYSWIQNSQEYGQSLSDALFEAESHRFKALQSFMERFVHKDHQGYKELVRECEVYLKKMHTL